jgi:hypothetical protein
VETVAKNFMPSTADRTASASQTELHVRAFARAIQSYPDRLLKDPRIRFDEHFMEVCGQEFLIAAETARRSAQGFQI